MAKKRHSHTEIAGKLAQAEDLARQGKLQTEIARTLGISVMTLHRWRKQTPPVPELKEVPLPPSGQQGEDERIAELEVENSRLRRLVTDLLLEKMRLEEAARDRLRRR